MGMFFLEERSLLLFIKFKLLEKKNIFKTNFLKNLKVPPIYIYLYTLSLSVTVGSQLIMRKTTQRQKMSKSFG